MAGSGPKEKPGRPNYLEMNPQPGEPVYRTAAARRRGRTRRPDYPVIRNLGGFTR